jgi:hypothetical protein
VQKLQQSEDKKEATQL